MRNISNCVSCRHLHLAGGSTGTMLLRISEKCAFDSPVKRSKLRCRSRLYLHARKTFCRFASFMFWTSLLASSFSSCIRSCSTCASRFLMRGAALHTSSSAESCCRSSVLVLAKITGCLVQAKLCKQRAVAQATWI